MPTIDDIMVQPQGQVPGLFHNPAVGLDIKGDTAHVFTEGNIIYDCIYFLFI